MIELRRAPGEFPLLVGHRGACAVTPGNTMASFQRALDDGADLIEMDVRLTADGHVVVRHDRLVDRTSDGSGPVAEMTLEAVKRLDAGSWFDPRFAGERVPTLAEVLTWARGKIGLFLELKYDPYDGFNPALAPAVVDCVSRHDMVEQVLLISYSDRGLAHAKSLLPEIATGPMPRRERSVRWTMWLVRHWPRLENVGWVRHLLLRPLVWTQAVGGDVLTPSIEIVTSTLVQAAHAAGMPVSSGGLKWDYPQAIAMGLDTVSANNPGLVRQLYLTQSK
ncbi:MAG: hypothetical protein DRI37_08730 [Chloroflexi bacterium]|nr:MAG: hypothetical protein DRI37_08730 [Chloroflexota bacterium]